jgi:hypothetical protein
MRSPYRAFKTDLIEHISYWPALASLIVQQQTHGGMSMRPVAGNTVISLTSFPARLGKLHNCIRSLLSQNVQSATIVLYLTREECAHIQLPRKLLALQDLGLEIRFANINVRSLNKIFHVLHDFPTHTIVTCDDDKIYPAGWLEGLLRAHSKYPRQIVCNRSRLIQFDDEGDLQPYRLWPSGNAQSPSMSLLPLGVGGVLYPATALHETVWDTKLYERLCPTSDDLWLKVMAMLKGTKTVQVPGTNGVYPSIPFWNGPKLSPENIWNDGNNTALTALMQHFSLSEADFTRVEPDAVTTTGNWDTS